MELAPDMTVNLGFGISSNVPRILLEEGRHGAVTWVIEQGAVGGVPLTGFAFGCASNAEAIMPSPHQFTYFQAGAFDAALLSFLQIDREGSVNVSRLSARPHVTAGAGGFVDITARAKRIVFSGLFRAGAKAALHGEGIRIEREGRAGKIVDTIEQVIVLRAPGGHAGTGGDVRDRALRDAADRGRADGHPRSLPASTSSGTCWPAPTPR